MAVQRQPTDEVDRPVELALRSLSDDGRLWADRRRPAVAVQIHRASSSTQSRRSTVCEAAHTRPRERGSSNFIRPVPPAPYARASRAENSTVYCEGGIACIMSWSAGACHRGATGARCRRDVRIGEEKQTLQAAGSDADLPPTGWPFGALYRDSPTVPSLVDEHGPQCVLFDVAIPGIGGDELCRRLRATCGDDIVLVAVTGVQRRRSASPHEFFSG